jgi:hypothetical protein
MLSRRQLATVDPSYAYPQAAYTNYRPGGQDQYGMHAMPPPVYDPNAPRPPFYEPPAGGTKMDPAQWRAEPTRRPQDLDYDVPPPEPPTAAANYTGSSNNPYRP